MKKTTILLAMATGFAALPAGAYEVSTHAAMVYKAYQKSHLNATFPLNATSDKLLKNLGIDLMLLEQSSTSYWVSAYPFGSAYYDVQGSTIMTRTASTGDYETQRINDATASGVDPSDRNLSGWLMRGAIREDDLGTAAGFNIGDDPHDDPYGVIWRVFNHFFDPVHNIPLTVGLFAAGETAPNWAIGTSNVFANPYSENTVRRNHFSIYDAREAMYRAITGQAKDGTNLGANGGPADENRRKTWWATMFRILGDTMHLNQDMAQPQHTRNEPHIGIGSGLGFNIGGNPIYETYIEARATAAGGAQLYKMDGTPLPLGPIDYDGASFGGYNIPVFTKFSDFWSTGTGDASYTGKGLADYSNHGFFTVSNNIGDTNYIQPTSDVTQYGSLSTNYPPGMQSQFVTTYLTGTVVDNNDPSKSQSGVRLSRESAWKDFATSGPLYSLDRNNFDDMAKLLIPRAVAYSAGILNYFFRGNLQISLPDEGVYSILDHSTASIPDGQQLTNFTGFSKIKLKLAAPDTDNNGQPQTMPNGNLIAVLKFHRNFCYQDNLNGEPPFINEDNCRTAVEEIVVSNTVSGAALSSTAQPFTFTFSNALPLNATDVHLQVVYRGQLGTSHGIAENDAVVVAAQDISEPTFFTYINASDYNTIGGSVYTRGEINADPNLLAKVVPQSCVDYTLAKPQLKPACLNPFDINLGLTIGSGDKQTQIDVQALPVKRFVRIAFLGDAATDISLGQKNTNTCFPQTAFPVDPLEWQQIYDASQNTVMTTYPEFQKVRGTSGWYSTSCVGNGDASTPGSPDNRNDVMKSLDTTLPPYAVTINGGNGF